MKKADGSPSYTLPVIFDDSTGAVISESFAIAEYLDKTYPDTPRLFPPGTKTLQAGFADSILPTLKSVVMFLSPKIPRILNPPSSKYYRDTRFGGQAVEVPSGKEGEMQWAKVKDELELIYSWMEKEEGLFVMGSNVCFVDIALAGYLVFMRRIWGEDSSEWKDFHGWFEAQCPGFIQSFEKYGASV
jgi:glutathione S-transferase